MAAQGIKNGTGKKKTGQKNVQRTSSSSEDESEDISLLGVSLRVSVNGVRQLIRAVLEGNKEVMEKGTFGHMIASIISARLCLFLFL